MVAIDQSQSDDWPPSISSKNPQKKKKTKTLKLLILAFRRHENQK